MYCDFWDKLNIVNLRAVRAMSYSLVSAATMIILKAKSVDISCCGKCVVCYHPLLSGDSVVGIVPKLHAGRPSYPGSMPARAKDKLVGLPGENGGG
jgi:hypothetical protein